MKCRRMKDNNIVWFGSYGVNEDGTAKRYDETTQSKFVPQANYADKQEAIALILKQKLSVIENELWYQMNFGMPLMSKQKSKGIIDSYVISIISKQQDIVDILEFNSSLDKTIYKCNFRVLTKYGVISGSN